ncbi:hypothetical protein MUK42_13845 [Musa troglodytarum]|uniref:Uncharacterized protein n=1 Tax=Musa troglodytarum TaxID=320322 RepID=A0A9E7KPX3_9LILI|nr:hypothetical protein MUK42_13845 [Musa troglodytarum]
MLREQLKDRIRRNLQKTNAKGSMRMTAIMEVGCDVTWKEERISSKIAGKEDEEQRTAEMAEKNEEKAKAWLGDAAELIISPKFTSL